MKIQCSSKSNTEATLGVEKVLKFTINQRLPSLNDIIKVAKQTGRGILYSNLKNKYTNIVCDSIPNSFNNVFSSIYLALKWFEKNRKRDPDNVAFAIKFILDGLCKKGVIINDNSKVIVGWNNKFIYGEDDKVEVNIYGVCY